MDYSDVEWFAWERDRDHSVIFEIAPKYSILDSFVDYVATPFFLRILIYHSCLQNVGCISLDVGKSEMVIVGDKSGDDRSGRR